MLSEYYKMAKASIKGARFRSFLTMFGIIVGVLSVITVASIGEGIKKQVAGETNAVGKDLITVRPGKVVNRDSQGQITGVNLLSFLSASSLSDKDIETISKNDRIESVVPFSIVTGTPSYENRTLDGAFVMATNENMPQVVNRTTDYGNFFEAADNDRNAAVIGFNLAEQLFKENVPVGKSFTIRGQEFIVSGVFERFPTNPLSPEIDYNNGVFIPYGAAKDLTGGELKPYELRIRPKDKQPEAVNTTIGSITSQLKQNHGGQEDFTVLRQEEMVNVAASIVGMVSKAVTVMAIIALIIGGIGIMNVMLVTVTERTREIGIRKAVGATNRQIRAQFLIEAILLSVWGAIIGILLAGFCNVVLRIITNLQPVITWQMVVGSALASVAVGIVFGMIPAIKASRKHPIESLRTF